jgi:hypothetical protein
VRIRRAVPCLAASIAAAMVLSGCHGFDRPISVLVRDAETKAPIPDAEVYVSDPGAHPPHALMKLTGEDGIVRMRVSPSAEFSLNVEATAKGYLPVEKDLPIEVVRALPSNPFVSAATGAPTIVLDVFSGPRPVVDLIVPTGYRGTLRVEVRARDDVTFPPGQRSFGYEVPPSGVIQVVGPPVLLHGLGPDIRAQYADGTKLLRDVKDWEVGLRWVMADGKDQVFVIGTRLEWTDIRKAMEKGDWSPHSGSSGSGSHQGGGRGGRGGGRGMMGGGAGG